MIGGMNAARNLRIATRSNSANTIAANAQSGPPDCKAFGSSMLALMPVEAPEVVTAMTIARRLARIIVVTVLRRVQVRTIQYYAEHGSLHIRQNLHASGQRLAGGCATTAYKNNAIDQLRQAAALRIGNDRGAVHHHKAKLLAKRCNRFFQLGRVCDLHHLVARPAWWQEAKPRYIRDLDQSLFQRNCVRQDIFQSLLGKQPQSACRPWSSDVGIKQAGFPLLSQN